MAKRQMELQDFVNVLFSAIQTDLPEPSRVPVEKHERVENELVYFSIFMIDFGMYLANGDSPERNVVMDVFWDMVNASGLNLDFLNERLQSYTEAAQAETRDESFDRLGKQFAYNCLWPDNDEIVSVGHEAAKRLVGEVAQLASSVEIDV